jgi:hypothetical protein
MWFAKAMKDLKWWDISLIKFGVFFFTLFVASYISNETLMKGRWIFLGLGILFAIKPWSVALKNI